MIGKTLAHYEITSQLGKGGMGEVFRAKDQKLGRDVTIKVLPEEFARDTDRVARFQREAKLLVSLNHPNIAAIHGLEESNGTHFLVLELIEGIYVSHWPGRQVPDDESGGEYGEGARRRISAQNQRCPQMARRAEAKGAGRLIKGAVATF